MKNITKPWIFLLMVLMIFTTCNQQDYLSDKNLFDPQMVTVKGKPLPAPGYPMATLATPVQVYGVWHAGNDYCTWGTVRTAEEFDSKNHWLIDRVYGSNKPSVNLVVLSFVNPLKLLNGTDDATTVKGIPKGMTSEIVNYFKSRNIRVMLSIGGITYTDAWNTALAQNATQLGLNASDVAGRLGVGIEIDYEENSNPNLTGLQAFM